MDGSTCITKGVGSERLSTFRGLLLQIKGWNGLSALACGQDSTYHDLLK